MSIGSTISPLSKSFDINNIHLTRSVILNDTVSSLAQSVFENVAETKVQELKGEVTDLKYDLSERDQKITKLNKENGELKNENGELKNENGELKNENGELKNKLQDTNNEKSIAIREKQDLFVQKERVDRIAQKTIERLEKKDLLKDMHPATGYGSWRTRIFCQKGYSDGNLSTLFHGYYLGFVRVERQNFFIQNTNTSEDRDRNKRVFEELIALKKRDIKDLTLSKMKSFEGIFEHVKVDFGTDKQKLLVDSLMDKIISNGDLTKHALADTGRHGVSLKPKPLAGWSAKEDYMFMTKTYETTVKEILSESLRQKVCDQISSILR